MPVEMGLFDFIERDHRIPDRARLDLLARDIEADVPVGPFHGLNCLRGYQHAFAEPPVARVDDEIL